MQIFVLAAKDEGLNQLGAVAALAGLVNSATKEHSRLQIEGPRNAPASRMHLRKSQTGSVGA